MRCIYLLLCISVVVGVSVSVSVSVKKLLYVEATVDAKDAISGERLSNTLEDLKKVLCLPGEECQGKKSHQETTYRPYYYPSRKPGYMTTYRPYYSYNTTRRYWHSTTRKPWNMTTFRPYYSHNTTRGYWNSTTYRPYDTTTRMHWNVTMDFFDNETKTLIDCSDLPAFSPSGMYNIHAEDGQVEVFCDMETDHGNWTVIQSRHISGEHHMNNSWEEYKDGFGKIKEDFWLGNKQISDMTTRRHYSLRVDIIDITGDSSFAKYEWFRVEPEEENFRLRVEGYSGNSGDMLHYHNGRFFSTYDMKNEHGDKNCSQGFGGGWWYRSCFLADLNSYMPFWGSKRLVTTEMKIRPADL